MNDALFELYDIAEKHGAPHQAFEAWAEKHFKPLFANSEEKNEI